MFQSMSPLFLSQSYSDNWDDYIHSLTRPDFPVWDYVIITASSAQQAQGFLDQIQLRKPYLPPRTHFAVIPDEGDVRVGSGGATLSVIRYIKQRVSHFRGQRILVIHSGGDSKRVPQYSALGKLFSPVPRELPDGRRSTLFDEFIINMSSMPSRIHEGMLLLSGDVMLLFNPLQIDYSGSNAAAISFKEHVETGKNHGVFLSNSDGNVARFLHKQTEATLRNFGAVNARDCVDIDTGAIIFSPEILEALFSLISSDDAYHQYVNSTVRLSLYGDFLFPMASDSTLDDFYLETPEGTFCEALHAARTQLWHVLRPYRIKLLRPTPAKFIHFGTTREVLKHMTSGIQEYAALGWTKQTCSSTLRDTACYNSILSDRANVGSNCYLESSYVHSHAGIGDNTVLSYIELHDQTAPSNVVMHGLKLQNGKYTVRIYGVQDDPKSNLLFGQPIPECIRQHADVDGTLWSANLYPVCDDYTAAIAASLNLYQVVHGHGDLDTWKKAERTSLQAGFHHADQAAIIAWDRQMSEIIHVAKLTKSIRMGKPLAEIAGTIRLGNQLTQAQTNWLAQHTKEADLSEITRLNYYIGKTLGGTEGDKYIRKCFSAIQSSVLSSQAHSLIFNDTCKIACDRLKITSPLRVNWGGGWSDTPPYCIENGGTVLNAAILLNGEKPVEVTLERIPEHKIIFDSRDMDVHGEFTSIAPLQQTGDPYDPFALQKAALIACGIIPIQGGDLDQILSRLGGGFVMNSEVTNVPKGSGLGTSSILSATCIKALMEFMAIPYDAQTLYSRTLCMEQIMATGGGWQDQVGGMIDGVKYITSTPGLQQNLRISRLTLSPQTQDELNARFALIYTGQRRLARNLLRSVIGRYIANDPDSVYALNEIQRVAALMRFELERDNVDEFAKLLDYHWTLSKKIDSGSSNSTIDQIFLSIDDLIDGKMICGAGGGGFLQVILKKNVSKEHLHQRLKDVFPDNDVGVWPCTFIF